MATITSGTSRVIGSNQDGSKVVMACNGGSMLTYTGTYNGTVGPLPERETVVLNRGESITVTCTKGEAQIESFDFDAQIPFELSADYVLTAGDDGKQFYCTTALVVSVPVTISALFDAPPTGNVTIRKVGSITLNGGTADLTRSLASNPAGFVIKPTLGVANNVGVSGS
jgi:hypothetical protein